MSKPLSDESKQCEETLVEIPYDPIREKMERVARLPTFPGPRSPAIPKKPIPNPLEPPS